MREERYAAEANRTWRRFGSRPSPKVRGPGEAESDVNVILDSGFTSYLIGPRHLAVYPKVATMIEDASLAELS